MNRIENATILLTGADSSIGMALTKECILRGAKKIYAAGLCMERLQALAQQYPGFITPLVLDVTNDRDILKAGGTCRDINMLINNAGVELQSSFIGADASLKALFEMKVNYIGVLNMINKFLPVLRKHKESAIVNILSVGSASNVTRLGTYCASKSATHVLTQSVRAELKAENIHVFGVYPGYAGTDRSKDIYFEIVSHEEIAENICMGIEAGTPDIFPDEISKMYYDNLSEALVYQS